MKRMILPMLAVAGIAAVVFSTAAQSKPEADTAKAADSSNVACYFRRNDGSTSWHWGLTSSNAYYSFSGEWRSTANTKIKKFFSTTEYSSICDACENSKAYYKEPGIVYAMFAATSNAGSNYPIILGDNEISPLY